MKRMTLISLALATALFAGVALAQPAPGHRPDPQAHLQHLSVILELSTQQQAQLRELLDAKREELEARREAREARRADREAFEQQIAALLDDKQRAKFDALKAARHAQRERRQGLHAGRHREG